MDALPVCYACKECGSPEVYVFNDETLFYECMTCGYLHLPSELVPVNQIYEEMGE